MKNKLLSWQEIYDKLGIKDWKSKSESGESKDILFSKFDKCHVDIIEYKNGEVKETRRYSREISKNFSIIYEYLSSFGYEIDYDYYDKKRYNNLCCDYQFIANGLPKIVIDFNLFHNDLFQININYGFDSTFHKMKDYKKTIFKSLSFHAKKDNNVKLLRHLKLLELLNE
jgi:hypothetical protein